ncbi:MAG: hypothetical protein J6V32_04955 [Elusimicrobiaceae bacterium]|nr:hypothetical protein [Elusimicrobiaceae bacterium]
MKKTILFITCTCLLTAGCLSKEQKEKVNLFWAMQIMNVMMKISGKAMPAMPMQPANGQMPVDYPNNPDAPIMPATNPEAIPQRPAPQVIDVMMDDTALPGKASREDRVRMKQALSAVQENNQKLLQDLRKTFGNNVKEKAFYITLETEKQLKQAAAEATTYSDYMAKQQHLLAQQEKAIAKLMQQNKASLKRLKK